MARVYDKCTANGIHSEALVAVLNFWQCSTCHSDVRVNASVCYRPVEPLHVLPLPQAHLPKVSDLHANLNRTSDCSLDTKHLITSETKLMSKPRCFLARSWSCLPQLALAFDSLRLEEPLRRHQRFKSGHCAVKRLRRAQDRDEHSLRQADRTPTRKIHLLWPPKV